jgi:hypothetical protein
MDDRLAEFSDLAQARFHDCLDSLINLLGLRQDVVGFFRR